MKTHLYEATAPRSVKGQGWCLECFPGWQSLQESLQESFGSVVIATISFESLG